MWHGSGWTVPNVLVLYLLSFALLVLDPNSSRFPPSRTPIDFNPEHRTGQYQDRRKEREAPTTAHRFDHLDNDPRPTRPQ